MSRIYWSAADHSESELISSIAFTSAPKLAAEQGGWKTDLCGAQEGCSLSHVTLYIEVIDDELGMSQ